MAQPIDYTGKGFFRNLNKTLTHDRTTDHKPVKELPLAKHISRNSKQETTVSTKKEEKAGPVRLRTAYHKYVKTAVQESAKPSKRLCLVKKEVETSVNRTFVKGEEGGRLRQCTKQFLNCTVVRKEVKSVLTSHAENSLPKNADDLSIKTQRKSEVQQRPKIFKGSFSLLCTSMRPALEITAEIANSLNIHKIRYKKSNEYSLTCQKQGVRLEIEVMRMEGMDFLHVVRFKKLEGSAAEYKATCSKLLSSTRL